MKSKRQVFQEELLQLPPRSERQNWASNHSLSLSCIEVTDEKRWKDLFDWRNSRRHQSFWFNIPGAVSKLSARNHRVTSGILPSCRSTEPKKAAVMARDVLFYIQKRAASHTKDRRRMGKHGSGTIQPLYDMSRSWVVYLSI